MHLFLFAAPSGADNVVFSLEPPDKKLMAKKCLLVLRARPPPKKDAGEPVVITTDNIDQEVIFIDLVQEGWVLVIFNLVLYGPVARFDIDVTDQNLLAIEAGNSKNS